MKLVKYEEEPIVSILVARGHVSLVKPGVRKFSNVQLTSKGKTMLGVSDIILTDEYIEELRSIFPPGYRGTLATIRAKLSDTISDYGLDLEKILIAARRWNRDHVAPYCGKLDYFISKEENGIVSSRLLEYYELIEDSEEVPKVKRIKNSRLDNLKKDSNEGSGVEGVGEGGTT